MDPSTSGRAHRAAGGAMFLSVFGTIWLILGAVFTGQATPLVIVPLLAVAALLIGAARHLRRTAIADPPSADAARMERAFMQINIVQYVAMALAILGANLAGRPDLIPLLISAIVAVHFLPLARLFRHPVYYATALAILLVDLIALLQASVAWATFGTGAILWCTALVQLIRGFGWLRASRAVAV